MGTTHVSVKSFSDVLKEWYGGAWYNVKGGKEELLRRIDALTPIEKLLLFN